MRMVIAGGGTGGHLFPGLAVARAVMDEAPDTDIVFVGTRRGIEARVMPETEFPIRFISSRGLRGTGLVNKIRGMVDVPRGLAQSWALLGRRRPHVVLGVGGYASGPTVLAAWMRGIPTAIQEQNSVMGTTNRWLARFVNRIFTSWEETLPVPPPHKTLCTGNPIRSGITGGETVPSPDSRLKVLIFGGSQGARSINLAMIRNVHAIAPLADRIALMHQTGAAAREEVAQAYREAGIDADVRGFIHDMGAAYQWADLVICRSGAGSLAELTAVGKPAVVVPYPHAIGDHQARNAAFLESRGAVRVVPDHKLQNGALVHEITSIADHPACLHTMAEQSRKLGRPEAARTIARELIALGRVDA